MLHTSPRVSALPLIGAALLLGAVTLSYAQPETEKPPAPVAASTDSEVQEDASQPLDDYEASEQISEDLSVSFPVDI